MSQPPIGHSAILDAFVPFIVLALIGSALKAMLTPSRRQRKRRSAELRSTSAADDRNGLRSWTPEWETDHQRSIPPGGRPIDGWTLEALQRLEWKRFETVSKAFLDAIGFSARMTRVGADGGIDLIMYRDGQTEPVAIAQCKAWTSRSVGVKPVRELYGVMAAEHVTHGIFFTTSHYTEEALNFAKGKHLELVSGPQLIDFIKQLTPDAQSTLLATAFEGDFETPTCPQCDRKMTRRVSRRGRNEGSAFWGCVNYPRCKQTFQIRTSD